VRSSKQPTITVSPSVKRVWMSCVDLCEPCNQHTIQTWRSLLVVLIKWQWTIQRNIHNHQWPINTAFRFPIVHWRRRKVRWCKQCSHGLLKEPKQGKYDYWKMAPLKNVRMTWGPGSIQAYHNIYRGAYKSLARPGRKQATFPAFYGTSRSITTFTTVQHLSLP